MLENIITFLKVLPGLAMFPISIVLALRKFGHAAEVTYSISTKLFSVEHINWLLIRNLKDKPLEIQSIYAVLDKDIRVELLQNTPPVVVKSLEFQEFTLEPVSHYHLRGWDVTHLDFDAPLEIFIVTANKVIKCKSVRSALHQQYAHFGDIASARPIRNRYKGRLYTADTAYAIDFECNGEEGMSFIKTSGMVFGAPPIDNTSIGVDDINDTVAVSQAVKELCESFGVSFVKLTKLNTRLILMDGYVD